MRVSVLMCESVVARALGKKSVTGGEDTSPHLLYNFAVRAH